MSRRNKKRTKRYSGEDAKPLAPPSNQPVVHKYEAVNRSALGEWWQVKKRLVKISAIAALVVILLVSMIVELFRLF